MKPTADNPYEPPKSEPDNTRRNRAVRFTLSLVASLVTLAILLLVDHFRPFGIFSDQPSTPQRRATAWVVLVVQLMFYGSTVYPIVSGIALLPRRAT
jgi:hypothetical protein